MNILFVAPEHFHGDMPSIGIMYMAALLKKHGYHVELLNFSLCHIKEEDISEKIKNFSPQLIAMSISSSHQIKRAKYIARMIKQLCDIPIIIGGVVMPVEADIFTDCKDIDMICIGEGEYFMLELCNKMSRCEDYSDIKGLWLRKDGDWIKNDRRPLEDKLDELPFPDRSLFPVMESAVIIASRGCPGDCHYCINRNLRQFFGAEKYLRYRSPENVVLEILEINKNYHPSSLWFYDDRFPIHREWVDAFVALCEKHAIRIPFSINIHPKQIHEELIKKLKKAGLAEVRMGIEHGDENFRKEKLNRSYSNKLIKNAFNLAKKYQLTTKAYNMIGIPGDTVASVLKTLVLNIKINPTVVQYSIFTAYPGTVLYDYCREKGYSIKDVYSVNGYYSESLLSTQYLPAKDVKCLYSFIQSISRRKVIVNLLRLFNKAFLIFILGCIYRLYRVRIEK